MGANKWGLVAGLVGVAALGGAVGALVMKPAAPAGPSQAEVQALRAELSDLRTQLQRLGRWLHAQRHAHEQRIVEIAA